MQPVTINIAALCDKAGRQANQDNIYLSCAGPEHRSATDVHIEFKGDNIPLPPEGVLLLVADGMGGMNAGEVASRLVVETMGSEFAALGGQAISVDNATSVARRAILAADSAIKQHVAAHPDAAGTGSTVVLLWLLGQQAVVAWCGDSRCYRYNPRRGLEQLSHDHSYVQQMVDEGRLRPELAFGHDQSNIITRCLSDDPQPAEPDVKVVDVYRDDMFLLCSDGLCGLLPDDVTEQLLRDAGGDVHKALSNCWQRGSAERWSDNTSVILAAVSGVDAEAPERIVAPLPPRPSYTTVEVEPEPEDDATASVGYSDTVTPVATKRRWWPLALMVVLLAAVALWFLLPKHGKPSPQVPDKPKPAAVVGNSPSVGKPDMPVPGGTTTTEETPSQEPAATDKNTNEPQQHAHRSTSFIQAGDVKQQQ